MLIGMIGSLDAVKLALLTQDHTQFGEAYAEYQGRFAILSGQGSISLFGDERIVHIHLTLATYESGEVIGGHLVEAEILNTAEIYIGELEYQLVRAIDPLIGTPELVMPE